MRCELPSCSPTRLCLTVAYSILASSHVGFSELPYPLCATTCHCHPVTRSITRSITRKLASFSPCSNCLSIFIVRRRDLVLWYSWSNCLPACKQQPWLEHHRQAHSHSLLPLLIISSVHLQSPACFITDNTGQYSQLSDPSAQPFCSLFCLSYFQLLPPAVGIS